MKRLPLAVALSLTIAACQQPAPSPASTAATPPGAPAKPENGTWGVDLTNLDTAITSALARIDPGLLAKRGPL